MCRIVCCDDDHNATFYFDDDLLALKSSNPHLIWNVTMRIIFL